MAFANRLKFRELKLKRDPECPVCGDDPTVTELEARTGREAATSAVYIALRRLEKKELLESRLESPEDSGQPYPRRYFALTDAALEPLRDARRSLMGLWDGLEPVLDD